MLASLNINPLPYALHVGLMRSSVKEEDVLKHMIQIGEQASIVFNEFTQRVSFVNTSLQHNFECLSKNNYLSTFCISKKLSRKLNNFKLFVDLIRTFLWTYTCRPTM